jgi:hypothetical protein
MTVDDNHKKVFLKKFGVSSVALLFQHICLVSKIRTKIGEKRQNLAWKIYVKNVNCCVLSNAKK